MFLAFFRNIFSYIREIIQVLLLGNMSLLLQFVYSKLFLFFAIVATNLDFNYFDDAPVLLKCKVCNMCLVECSVEAASANTRGHNITLKMEQSNYCSFSLYCCVFAVYLLRFTHKSQLSAIKAYWQSSNNDDMALLKNFASELNK